MGCKRWSRSRLTISRSSGRGKVIAAARDVRDLPEHGIQIEKARHPD
jgi:hypothetical protein